MIGFENNGRRSPLSVSATSLILLVLLFLSGGMEQAAGQTTITREVVSGGGGKSENGSYTVRGTVSQTAVGRLRGTGSIQRHAAGFWYNAVVPDVITTISIPHIETNVGTRITLPMELITTGAINPITPRRFTAHIRFNSTILFPVDGMPDCSYDGELCTMEISGTATTENGTIAELHFITALGTADSTPVDIVDFEWDAGRENHITPYLDNGSVRLLDVCREGGEMRLVTSGPAARIAIRPNPATIAATLDLTPAESGPVTISIVDILGNELRRFDPIEVEAGRYYPLDLDISTLPSGSYMVICRTPSEAMTQRLIIRE